MGIEISNLVIMYLIFGDYVLMYLNNYVLNVYKSGVKCYVLQYWMDNCFLFISGISEYMLFYKKHYFHSEE